MATWASLLYTFTIYYRSMVIEPGANNFSRLPLLANLRLGAEKTALLMGEPKEDEHVIQNLSPAQGAFYWLALCFINQQTADSCLKEPAEPPSRKGSRFSLIQLDQGYSRGRLGANSLFY